MAVSKAHIRKRAIALHRFQLPDSLDSKLKKRLVKQLKWGFVNHKIQAAFEDFQQGVDVLENEPLSFAELTSSSSWFQLHPEKVAGKEVATTSFIFPVTIKGTKQEVLDTINRTLQRNDQTKHKKMNLLRLRAKAAQARLQLLNLTV